jgi:hypothetical protein
MSVSLSIRLSVYLHGRTRHPLKWFLLNFDLIDLRKKCREKITGSLHKGHCKFVIVLYVADFFLEWQMFHTKGAEKVKIKFHVQWISLRKSCRLWDGLAWLGFRFYSFLIGLEGLWGESRRIALLLSVYLGTRWVWVVSTTPRPLVPRERPRTHRTGGWVGLGAGLDRCGKPRPHRNSIPGPSGS